MTAKKSNAQGESEFPKISKPALRVLNGAGYFRLVQLTQVSKTELSKLHGVGPKALGILRQALMDNGWTFKKGEAK